MTGFSFSVFLPHGDPDGLRIVEKSYWTGLALMTRRDRLQDDLKREEFKSSGVYVLLGPGHGSPTSRRIYIGEGSIIADRIIKHITEKDYWTELVLFTTKDGSLDKTTIGYLEAVLLQKARDAARAEIENIRFPEPSDTTESKEADFKSFLNDMLVIFQILGIDVFESVTALSFTSTNESQPDVYSFGLGGTKGRGEPTKAGFLVLRGSRGRAENHGSINRGYADLRQGLIDTGVAEVVDEELIFRKDYEFGSPSAAGAALYGGMVSGPLHWKRERDQKSIKEIEAERMASLNGEDNAEAPHEPPQ